MSTNRSIGHSARRVAIVTALAAGLCATVSTTVAAAPYTVTSLSDNGGGTLRQAIDDANANPGADTITFDPSVSGGTITLLTTLPAISDDLTIDGTGQSVIISGGGLVRILSVNSPKTLTLSALTIANGKVGSTDDGGGVLISNSGVLIVGNCTFSNNSAGSRGGAISQGDRI